MIKGNASGSEKTIYISIIYLFALLIVFVIGWLNGWIAISIVLVLTIVCPRRKIWLGLKSPQRHAGHAPVIALCAGATVSMMLLSGIMPPLGTNSDWLKDYAIFDALSTNQWPVILSGENGPELLRYSIGWYLIPSLVATQPLLQWVAAAWTGAGMFLALCLLVSLLGWEIRAAAVAVPSFLLFGGADAVGQHILGTQPILGNHYEWWAEFAQYTGHMTGVFCTTSPDYRLDRIGSV
jgi:hypothetical protein